MSSLLGGAVSLAGAVTKKLPLGGALGGAPRAQPHTPTTTLGH